MRADLSPVHSSSNKAGTILPPVLLFFVFGSFFWRFTYPRIVFLSFFTDDFFYYLIVARNLALNGTSTFNGIVPTNGYHPLWLLTISLLERLLGDARAFFVALLVLIWLLVCGTYRLLRALQTSLGLQTGFELPCALFSTIFMAFISRTGMEVSLAIFFLVFFWLRLANHPLEEETIGGAALSGLLASAAILSRLDAILPIAAYLLLFFLSASALRRRFLINFAGFTAGSLPVAAYVLTNIIYFHTLLPVSGMAKNLKQHSLISSSTLQSLSHPGLVQFLFVWPSILLVVVYAVRLFGKNSTAMREFTNSKRRVQLCIALHPVIFYFTLSVTSDWPLWTWYFYPLVSAAAILGPEVLSSMPRPARSYLTAATALLVAVVCVGMARPNRIAVHMNSLAADIQNFAATHPGRYAMGDAGGTPAFLIPQPILQLEGLMGDRAFLAHIQKREPLPAVLTGYGIDYYITNAATQSGDCYDVNEPSKAGPRSPTMPGHLCLSPVARFDDPTMHSILIFDMRSLKSLVTSR